MTTTEKDVDTMKSFRAALEDEIKNVDETLLPLLREYLNNVRDVRMAMAREVKEILQSSRELGELTKKTNDIREFCAAVLTLEEILTPSVMDKMKRFTRD